MNPITLSVLVLLSAFAAKNAKAADLPVKYDHVEYKQSGNTFKWEPLTGKTPGGNGVVFRGATGISDASPKISTLARLPFDKRVDVPVSEMMRATSPITKANFAKALTMAGRVAWPVGVLMTAGEIFNFMSSLGLQDIQNGPDGITAKQNTPGSVSGKEFSHVGTLNWFPTTNAACDSLIAQKYKPPVYRNASSTGVTVVGSFYYCNISLDIVNNPGKYNEYLTPTTTQDSISVRTNTSNTNSTTTLNQQQIEDLIASKTPGWPSNAARALQSALNTPGVTVKTEPPTVSGPASTPGTTTTTTTQTQVAPGTTTPVAPGTPGAQPATQKTTTTTTNNATYNNNTVTHNTKTTTTTNITNNVTNQTETKTDKEEVKEEENKEDESPPTDTDLTKVPELYERKYPDGMVGIWNTKSQEIKQSPLFTLADDLMPTGISGGTCPSWSLDLSFGGAFGDYGAQDVSPPCWIWDVARLIIIASALILARALVFGG